jgi:predicted nucleic acid-binding protein
MASGASVLWTEDLTDGSRIGILQIRNPFGAT